MVEARRVGRRLAKDHLETAAELFGSLMRMHLPTAVGAVPQGTSPNVESFDKYARLWLDALKTLAPYQSPTFRAITIVPPPPEKTGDQPDRYTLTIFETGGKMMAGELIAPNRARRLTNGGEN